MIWSPVHFKIVVVRPYSNRHDPKTREVSVNKRCASLSPGGEGALAPRGAFDAATYGQPLDWRVFVDDSGVDVVLESGRGLLVP